MGNPKLNERSARSRFSLACLCDLFAVFMVALPAFAQTTNYDFNLQVNSGKVYTLALQPDGRILVGSIYSPLRLLTNGTLDATFDPRITNGPFQGTCYSMAVQDDGKILIGGNFNSMAGLSHTNLGRFNADGSIDNGFNTHVGPGFVFSLAVDSHGGKLVGGVFQTLGGQPRSNLGRLDAEDITDSSFAPALDGTAFSLAVQSDGRVLAGGYFNSIAGQSRTNLGRLNSDGTLDQGFNPAAIVNEVECFAGQADGKILAGTSVSNSMAVLTNLVRLNSDGSPDDTFNPAPNSAVYSLAVQADGKIILGGAFTNLGGEPRMGLGRINADGSLDTNFVPIAYDRVYSLALQEDGKILIGGLLVDSTGQPNSYVGRLQNTSPATQNLSYEGTTITLMRGGTSPEVWGTRFQNSTNGSVWTELGPGTRIPGGWQLTSVVLPPGSMIRAQGRVSAGQYNGASWFVETKLQLPTAPQIIVDNGNFGFHSNQFGFDLIGPTNSSVVVESSPDLSNWTPLATNVIESGSIHFSDPATRQRAFYRLRLQ